MADIFARTRHIEGTTGEWTLNNLILGDGELAIERQAAGPVLRVGDGILAALSAPIIAAIAEYIQYGNVNLALALNAHRVESMDALLAGQWPDIKRVYVSSFYGGWETTAGPKGYTIWHFDGTTGGAPTTNTAAGIIAAMATGKVISLDGRGWVLSDTDELYLSQFGAVDATDNSNALASMLTLAAARRIPCTLDMDSTLAGIVVPTYTNFKARANITFTSTAAAMMAVTDADFVKLDFGWDQGFTVTRSGDERIVHITATADYGNKNVEVINFDLSGGTGHAIEWFGCEKLWFMHGTIHGIDGIAIYSVSNLVTNPFRSRGIVFFDLDIHTLDGANTCSGISVTAWVFVDNAWINKCRVNDVKSNGIEVWAAHVHCWENIVTDAIIAFSFGACHYLHAHDNEANVTTPSAVNGSSGGYGIEIGSCHFFNVHHNQTRGMRSGIRTTGGAIAGGTDWYTSTELYSEVGTLDPADTNKLRVLSRDIASGINFTGSYAGIIDSNVLLDSLNNAIYSAMDYYHTRAVKISNNLANRVGRYAAPTETNGAIACVTGKFEVIGNTIEDTLNAAIYNLNSRVILGPNTVKTCAAAIPYSATGLGASFNFLSRQDLSGVTIAGAVAAASPTQGTYFAGDTLYSHTPAAAGSLGLVCTTPGSQSNQLNTRTATTTNGSTAVVLAANIGDAQIGVRFTIAGVTGTKTITDVNYATNTLTIDVAADASVAGAAIAHAPATFKALPSIAA